MKFSGGDFMLSKLLKYDLKKNMRWMWILFVATIGLAGITRAAKEIGESVAMFSVIAVFLEGVYYGLAVNLVLQPFLRNFLNLQKSFYSDEAYLTHTIPVTKNQLVNSKYLTAIIEIGLGFASLIASLLIMYAGPGFLNGIKLIISTIVNDSFSVAAVIILFISLVIVEFLMFISIIYFAIVMAYKSKDKRLLRAFLIAAGCAMASLTVLFSIMMIVFAINGVKFTVSTIVLSGEVFMSVLITGIVVYLAAAVLFYFLTKREFNKGVNVD